MMSPVDHLVCFSSVPALNKNSIRFCPFISHAQNLNLKVSSSQGIWAKHSCLMFYQSFWKNAVYKLHYHHPEVVLTLDPPSYLYHFQAFSQKTIKPSPDGTNQVPTPWSKSITTPQECLQDALGNYPSIMFLVGMKFFARRIKWYQTVIMDFGLSI